MSLWRTMICLAATGGILVACSKSPDPTAQSTGPENALTRYAENLATGEARAKETADKANAAISKTQEQAKVATDQQQ